MKSAMEKTKRGRRLGSARGGEVTVLNKLLRKGLTKIR